MLNFENIQAAMTAFDSGELSPKDAEFTIADVTYRYKTSSTISYRNALVGKEGYLIYSVHPSDKDKMANHGLREWIALVYTKLKPKRLFATSSARLNYKMNAIREADESGRSVIGDLVELRFTNLPSSSILKGKVDTGADICSLHCDNYDIDRATNRISFTCRHLSNNQMTLPLSDIQAVKTADGVKNRPVIEMSVKIGEQVIDKVKFNLKDRSDMDHPVLVGQNLLDAGKFLIDPNTTQHVAESEEMREAADIDWEYLRQIAASIPDGEYDAEDQAEHFDAMGDDGVDVTVDLDDDASVDMDVPVEDDLDDDKGIALDKAFQLLRGSDITFSELLDYASTYEQDEPDYD